MDTIHNENAVVQRQANGPLTLTKTMLMAMTNKICKKFKMIHFLIWLTHHGKVDKVDVEIWKLEWRIGRNFELNSIFMIKNEYTDDIYD